MKAKSTAKKRNLALPATESMTQEEFMAMIKEAEKGPFVSNEEFKKKFEKWKKEYLKSKGQV